MDITPRRRRALSTVLALLLAVESVSAVAAAAQVNVAGRGGPGAAGSLPSAGAAAVAATPDGRRSSPIAGAGVADRWLADESASRSSTATTATPVSQATPAAAARATHPHLAVPNLPRASHRSTGGGATSPVDFHGRNHVWIPSLGISRSVSWFSCDRSRPPDNYVYRWGCAGSNNVYLLGHAYSVFKPLHDAYVSGRLHKGMKAYYADGKGVVHAYAVRWWRVTAPTTSASWAWASLSTPSMTLQTCVGSNSQYRLMVRLVQVKR